MVWMRKCKEIFVKIVTAISSKLLYIYMRWVQITPGVTLVKLHIFYTVDF